MYSETSHTTARALLSPEDDVNSTVRVHYPAHLSNIQSVGGILKRLLHLTCQSKIITNKLKPPNKLINTYRSNGSIGSIPERGERDQL